MKLPWYEAPEVQWGWIFLCGLVLASTLIWIPSLWRDIRRRVFSLSTLARGLAIAVSILFGMFVFRAFGQLFFLEGLAGIPLSFGISAAMASAFSLLWIPTMVTFGLGDWPFLLGLKATGISPVEYTIPLLLWRRSELLCGLSAGIF